MRHEARRRKRGFTLIETLVAGMILALAAAVMATALSHSYGSLSDARDFCVSVLRSSPPASPRRSRMPMTTCSRR